MARARLQEVAVALAVTQILPVEQGETDT